MNGDPRVYEMLQGLNIPFDYYEHPEAPTVEIASKYWKDIDAAHCKNLFFRNHKGNRHYLVILHYQYVLQIKELEARLKQGKLTFASEERMHRYLGLRPGSVSPFGLMYDHDHHVHLFIDRKLCSYERISFHPNLNTASLVIAFNDLIRFLDHCGNTYEFVDLY
jgi:Ala-tRNA(Pro) deacylase